MKEFLKEIFAWLILVAFAWVLASPFVLFRAKQDAEFWHDAYMKLSDTWMKQDAAQAELLKQLKELVDKSCDKPSAQTIRQLYEMEYDQFVTTNSYDNCIITNYIPRCMVAPCEGAAL